MAIDNLLNRQCRSVVTLEALALLAVLGVVDYSTGWELSVSLLYAVIILQVAWRGGRNTALAIAVLSAAIWFAANLQVHPYTTKWAYGWATFTRLAYFVFVAIGGASLRAYREANRAKIQALEHARELEHEIARASESEQRRIGQDLHDGLCQSLAAIQFALSTVREDLQEQRPTDADSIREIARMVSATISEARNLARGVFPVQMEEVGLAAVLDELVAGVKRHNRIEAEFEMQGDVGISDPEVAMHLYRIAQEAVSNAQKHGRPRKLAVSLRGNENTLDLTVSDDGIGLSPTLTPADGMGLKTMRHRANLIGASLNIRSNSGGGVSVVCSLPRKDASSINPTSS